MTRNQKFVAGMGTGAVMGMTAVIGLGIFLKKKGGKGMMKTAGKAVKAFGDIMDELQELID